MSEKLIAVEGIDGAGKTTFANKLAVQYRAAGTAVVVLHEPTNGDYGKQLKESAKSGRMSLTDETICFLLDRAQHLKNKIIPALNNGCTVILDRYYYSTIAYQGARGADVGLLTDLCETMFPRPDRTWLLDIEPYEATIRIKKRGEADEFEKLKYLTKVCAIYKKLALTCPEVFVLSPN